LAKPERGATPPAGDGGTTPPPAPGGGTLEVYPKEVMAVYEAVKTLNLGTSVIVGNETFFLASLGRQDKGGARVAIADVTTSGSKAVVKVRVTAATGPKAASVYTPIAVEVAKGQYSEVEFIRTDGEYFPILRGAKGPLAAIGESNNIRVTGLSLEAGRLTVTGLARVFEATVSWELRDGSAKVITKGFTNAASGGPDWAYYEIKLTNVPTAAAKIAVFWSSPKDGAPLDPVELALPKS
jgi:hypothetical protein